jgi:hypothetical protein
LVEIETTGAKLQGLELMQGISPFDESAGAAERHTSRFSRNEPPFCGMVNEYNERGPSSVHARTRSSMIETHFMFEI